MLYKKIKINKKKSIPSNIAFSYRLLNIICMAITSAPAPKLVVIEPLTTYFIILVFY